MGIWLLLIVPRSLHTSQSTFSVSIKIGTRCKWESLRCKKDLANSWPALTPVRRWEDPGGNLVSGLGDYKICDESKRPEEIKVLKSTRTEES